MNNIIKQIENHSLLNQKTASGKLKQIDILVRYSSGFLTKVDKYNIIFESNDFVYRLCLDELNDSVLNRVLSALNMTEFDNLGHSLIEFLDYEVVEPDFTEYVETVDYSMEDCLEAHESPYYTTY